MNHQRTPQSAYGLRPRIDGALRLSALALALLLAPHHGRAEMVAGTQIAGVLELFTSQGCASCPPADAVLTDLSAEGEILALSYHVDYWDYIGWKDPLASTRNSERQRAYANAMGTRTVFTPQMVVNGERDVPAADEAGIREALGDRTLEARWPDLVRLSREGSTLHIQAAAPETVPPGAQAVLVLVTYRPRIETAVDRGENQGKRLVNTHAVRDWQIVAKMNGRSIDVDMPISSLAGTDGDDTECAVLVQVMEEDGSPGAILAAAKLAF